MIADFVLETVKDFALALMAIFIVGIFGYYVQRIVEEIGELFKP